MAQRRYAESINNLESLGMAFLHRLNTRQIRLQINHRNKREIGSFSISPMRFTLLHGCFALLCLSIEGSHALTPEVCWKYVLPNSPMPKAIKELLKEGEASKHLNGQPSSIFPNGVSKNQLKDQPSSIFPSYGASKDQLKDQPSSIFPSYGASKDQLQDQPFSIFPSYGASKDQLKDQPSSYFPSYGASKDQLKDQPSSVWCI
ncbi:hypothetical protein L1987_61256 [Smallanthus sonchifolius]|uniref:Uncharacterized protein n=1 Tax=Smallanthus sonchifolius TaxID=185202 RepID=A0ACB9DB74_9ASTR|nr:hypothetical protein L1987_61256 [Smallanthus sonchifolius]